MKFGVREIANVVFKAKADTQIGNTTFKKGQPVLYIDTATTSTIEGAATTVYAQGGRGNTRLIAWEGEKTLTFTVEDALLSPIGFSMLSGAGLFKSDEQKVHVHATSNAYVDQEGKIDLTDSLGENEEIDPSAPVFVMVAEADGSVTGDLLSTLTVDPAEGKSLTGAEEKYYGKTVFVDFYIVKESKNVSELQIDAEHFAGNYYVEASTLFRDQNSGVDMPAEITLPNVKIQSNFTFNMAATGDPSTFTFTMDAFPGYTTFDRTKKVLCVIQVVEDAKAGSETRKSVMGHPAGFDIDETELDSTDKKGETEEDIKVEINAKVPAADATTSSTFGSRKASDFQENISIDSSNVISGNLKYLDNFEQFSTKPEERKGNYLLLEFPGGEGATVKTNTSSRTVKLDEDTQLILRVDKANKDRMTVTVTLPEGDATTYKMSGLTLADAE